jgi:cell division protease FtsH
MIAALRLPVRHLSGSARPGPPDDTPPRPPPPQTPSWWLLLLPVSIVLALIAVPLMLTEGQGTRSLTYSDFAGKVSAGQVRTVTIDDHGGVQGTLSDGKSFTSRLPTALNNAAITQRLQAKGVKITAKRAGSSAASQLAGVLPLVLLVAFFLWIGRRGQTSMMGGANTFGGPGRKSSKPNARPPDSPTRPAMRVSSRRSARSSSSCAPPSDMPPPVPRGRRR